MNAGGVVRRWLKVADPTAITARETLQRALGYGRKVAAVSRSEVFSFTWEDGGEDPREALERLIRETNLLLNPNKHFAEVLLDEDVPRLRGNAWVLVWEPGNGAELAEVVGRRGLLPFALTGSGQGVLWELELEGDGPEVHRLAGEIAVTRGRHAGLLANPSYQETLVLEEPPGARRLIEALGAVMAGGMHGGN